MLACIGVDYLPCKLRSRKIYRIMNHLRLEVHNSELKRMVIIALYVVSMWMISSNEVLSNAGCVKVIEFI